jgi:cbb3-type cytochrome oxidase maturation protein
MSYSNAFLAMWIGFAVMTMAGVGAVLWWAIKSGQFKDNDRARYLPLMSGIPEDKKEKDKDKDKDKEKEICSATIPSGPSGPSQGC